MVFLEFQSIELVSRPIEIVIKVLVWLCVFRSVLDCYWINRRYFRSIESNFRSIENRIESFLKPLFLTCFSLFKTFSKHLSLSLRSVKASNQFFVVFPFYLLRLVRLFCPSFCIYLHVSCIFSCILWGYFEPMKILGFWCFQSLLLKLINGLLLWDDINLIFEL